MSLASTHPARSGHGAPSPAPKSPSRRRHWLLVLAVLSLLLAAGGVCFDRWDRRPRGPDPATADMHDISAFIASDAYRNMYHWQRRRYLDGVVQRMEKESFSHLALFIFFPSADTRRAEEAIRAEPDGDDVAARMLTAFLQKFYEMPKAQRDIDLMLLMAAYKIRNAVTPPHVGMPNRQAAQQNLKAEMARIMAHQTPQGCALMAQFFVDQEKMGATFGVRP